MKQWNDALQKSSCLLVQEKTVFFIMGHSNWMFMCMLRCWRACKTSQNIVQVTTLHLAVARMQHDGHMHATFRRLLLLCQHVRDALLTY